MRNMEELKMLLCDELDMIAGKGELTAGSLDTIDKLTHSIKSLLTIMAMEGYGDSYDRYGRSYYDGRGYDGRSYAQRRDSMGRYSRRGYSRDGDIEEKITEIMHEVSDPAVKKALQKVIDKMED